MGDELNPCPIIGILCIDVAMRLLAAYGSDMGSYIDASYVKFLEFTGCRVIPIWIGKEYAYYYDVMRKINGILIPGGSANIESSRLYCPAQTNKCVESVGKIYRVACELNRRGTYFPLWGTCLGYELMLYHAFKDECDDELREKCRRMNSSTRIKLTPDFVCSKMFGKLSTEIIDIFLSEPFAFHSHGYCITIDKLQSYEGSHEWRVTSTNCDKNGLEYISSLEHRRYPFYGVQFHPEKILFDYARDKIIRNQNIILCAQYFANFFASECRKCQNVFPSKKDLRIHLIQNYTLAHTPVRGYEQCYLFLKENAQSSADLREIT